MIRVFLVEDHDVVRQGIAGLLAEEPDIEVVGGAGTILEAAKVCPGLAPDVALLDVRLPDGTGVDLCRELRSILPNMRCIMLTSYADDEALFSSIMAGASGYLLKKIRLAELADAIRRVAAGESLIDPAVTAKVLERIRNPNPDEDPLLKLSEQERRIFDLITEGKTNREIAQEIFLAEKTVKNYVSNLLQKLGVKHRTEVAALGARLAERRRQQQTPPA
jgi:DNA-binding NarL/FixJ family response regulator